MKILRFANNLCVVLGEKNGEKAKTTTNVDNKKELKRSLRVHRPFDRVWGEPRGRSRMNEWIINALTVESWHQTMIPAPREVDYSYEIKISLYREREPRKKRRAHVPLSSRKMCSTTARSPIILYEKECVYDEKEFHRKLSLSRAAFVDFFEFYLSVIKNKSTERRDERRIAENRETFSCCCLHDVQATALAACQI